MRGGMTRDDGHTLKQEEVAPDIWKNILTVRTVKQWIKFPKGVVQFPHLEVFKT